MVRRPFLCPLARFASPRSSRPSRAAIQEAVRASAGSAIESLEERRLFSTLTINGTAGIDTLIYNGSSYTLNGTTQPVPSGTTFASIFLDAGADKITINKVPAGVTVLADGGDDADSFTVGAGKFDANIQGDLQLFGGDLNNNTLFVDDHLNTADGGTVSFNGTEFSVAGTHFVFDFFTMTFSLGSGDDSFFLNKLFPGNNIVVKGNNGNEFFDIGAGDIEANIQGKARFEGGSGKDDLDFNDFSDESGSKFTLGNGTLNSPNLPFGGMTFLDNETMNFNMGLGNDTIDARNSNLGISVDFSDGADTGLGSSKADFFAGGTGNDKLSGNGGADTLDGAEDNDTLDGGEGNDSLIGGTENDVYKFANALAAQTDTIEETPGGVDTLDFSLVTNSVTANLKSDTLATHTNRTVKTAVAGGFAFIDNVVGGSAPDSLTGNNADNVFTGNGGGDTLIGNGGKDTLNGNAGNDIIDGGEGNDILTGGADNDTYKFAEALVAQTDKIAELAGQGTDTLDFSALTTSAVTVNLLSNTLATHTRRTVLTSVSGQFSNIENATGGRAADRITGNNAPNLLIGNAGGDTLSGGNGDDILDGGEGNDILSGGANNDTYRFSAALAAQTDKVAELAGQGTDTFDFSAVSASTTINLLSNTIASHTNRTVLTNVAGQFVNFENAKTGSGADKLFGNNAINVVRAGGGADQLTGGGAADQLFGEAGSDKFFAADGIKDLLDGGADTDSLGSSDGIDTKISIP